MPGAKGDETAGAAAFLEKIFPSARLRRGGEDVGCWFGTVLPDGEVSFTRIERFGPRDVRAMGLAFWDLQSVDPGHITLAWADPSGPATSGFLDDEEDGDQLVRGRPFQAPSSPHGAYAVELGRAVASADGATLPDGIAATAGALADAVRSAFQTLTARQAGELAMARAEAVAADVGPLLSTLDPEAVALLRAHAGDTAFTSWEYLHGCYEGLDATMTAGALLRRCIERFPDLAGTLLEAWEDDPMWFVGAGDDVTRDDVDEAVEGILGERWSITGRALHATHEIQAMLAARPDHRPGFLDGHDQLPDRLVGHLMALDALPARAWPGVGSWDAWCATVEVVHGMLGLVGPKRLARALDLRRGWDGLAARVRELADASDGSAWDGVFACSQAFARQLLVPAAALSRGGVDTELFDEFEVDREATVLLFSGDDAIGVLSRVARWREAGPAIDALARPKPRRVPESERTIAEMARGEAWAAVLPAHAAGNLSLTPLVDERSVTDAGDALGWGLDREASQCVMGMLRLAAVTRTGPSGSADTVALALIQAGEDAPVSLDDLRGSIDDDGVEDLSDDVRSFVRSYVDGLDPTPGAYVFPMAGHATARTDPATIGYAWREPGAWEAVRDAWAPALPPALASASAPDLAHLLDMVAETDEEVRWLPGPIGAPAMRRTRARGKPPSRSPGTSQGEGPGILGPKPSSPTS